MAKITDWHEETQYGNAWQCVSLHAWCVKYMYISVTCSKSNTFLFLTIAVVWRYTTGKRDVIVVHGGIRILPVPQVLVPLSPRLGRGACKTGTVKTWFIIIKLVYLVFLLPTYFGGFVCSWFLILKWFIFYLFIYLHVPICMNLYIYLYVHSFFPFFLSFSN